MTEQAAVAKKGLWGILREFGRAFSSIQRDPFVSNSPNMINVSRFVDGSDSSLILGELMLRYGVAIESEKIIKDFIKNKDVQLSSMLAIADVFAEKALIQITRRANKYAALGFLFIIIFSLFSWYALDHLMDDYYKHPIYSDVKIIESEWTGYSFSLELSRHLAIGAIFAACMYLSGSLAKAFVQEATQLFNRRHGIRSGRLAIWLRQGDITPAEIAMFFGVSAGEKSAFMDIDASMLAKTPMGTAADIAKAAADAAAKKAAN